MKPRRLAVPTALALTLAAGGCASSTSPSDAAADVASSDAMNPTTDAAPCVCGPNCTFVAGEVMCPAAGGGLCRPPPGCAVA